MKIPETEDGIIPALLQIAPKFSEQWKEHLDWWGDETDRGIYNDIAAFAHFVVDTAENDKSWMPELFQLIEMMITNGNEHVKELAIIGILEDIQTISSWRPHKGEIFLQWLGPESKVNWDKLNKLWSKYGNLMDIVRAENENK
ncbi:hypothetical protein [Dehalogenimonas sp. 4OHTPN]|uniref:DUF7674 domain-containing protein n=1 Tax=Dehalogenimonas sp. 4OHTPN TaxID=3166643 RepID=A0AAU8G9P7_9CHLR